MYLFHRAALALYDFRGDNSRKRKDQLLSTFDRKNAAGDVVQIQICLRGFDAWLQQVANIVDDWPLIKQNPRPRREQKVFATAPHSTPFLPPESMPFSYQVRCLFHQRFRQYQAPPTAISSGTGLAARLPFPSSPKYPDHRSTPGIGALVPDLTDRNAGSPLHFAARIALLAAVYFLAGRLGFIASAVHPVVSSAWPPSGIALAALLLYGKRLWPGITIGAFVVNVTGGIAPLAAASIAVGNTLEGFSPRGS